MNFLSIVILVDVLKLILVISGDDIVPIFQSPEMPEPPDATDPEEEFTEDFGDPEAEPDTGKH